MWLTGKKEVIDAMFNHEFGGHLWVARTFRLDVGNLIAQTGQHVSCIRGAVRRHQWFVPDQRKRPSPLNFRCLGEGQFNRACQ